jgi:anti-sigma B factor antagonist
VSDIDDLPFGLEVVEATGLTTFVLTGDLDLVTAGDVEPVLRDAQAAGNGVALDLRALRFIDSSGLRLVLEAQRRAEAAGTRVVVATGDGTVKRVFDLSGVGTLVEIVDAPPESM